MEKTLRTRLLVTILILVLVAVFLVVAFFLNQRRMAAEEQLKQMSVRMDQINQQKENDQKSAILARLGKHIMLPEGIKPTVAEIMDIATLRARSSFYNNADNGDYLIVTNVRAILYSPTKDRIIDVMPIQLERNTPGGVGQLQP